MRVPALYVDITVTLWRHVIQHVWFLLLHLHSTCPRKFRISGTRIIQYANKSLYRKFNA
jgi:hypothetical protein